MSTRFAMGAEKLFEDGHRRFGPAGLELEVPRLSFAASPSARPCASATARLSCK